jgi:hypothetical protein
MWIKNNTWVDPALAKLQAAQLNCHPEAFTEARMSGWGERY